MKSFDKLLRCIVFLRQRELFKQNYISEKDCIVSDDRRLSEIFNTYFMNITKTLSLKPSIISTTKSLPKIIETSKDHPSITNFFFAKGEVPKGRYQ